MEPQIVNIFRRQEKKEGKKQQQRRRRRTKPNEIHCVRESREQKTPVF